MKHKVYQKVLTAVFLFVPLAGGVLTGFSSCSSFLEDYSQDLAKVQSWEDLDELLLGDGYLPTSRLTISNSMFVTTDVHRNFELLHFMTDELTENYYSSGADLLDFRGNMYAFYTWQQDTGVDETGVYIGGDEQYWDRLYEHINTCNIVLSLIDEQPAPKASDRIGRTRVKGEALFLRAAYYFLLANLYAEPYQPASAAQTPGVPLKLTEFVEDKDWERATLSEVYQQIVHDLTEAEQLLNEATQVSVYHANVTAVRLLLSRVCLYMQDWQKAADYARQVVEDDNTNLLNLRTVAVGQNCISATSPETIFTMGGYLVALAFYEMSIFTPTYYIADDMVQLFTEDDLRSDLYIGGSYYSNSSPILTKFSGQYPSVGNYQDVSDCFLLRKPEAYLTLAEASALNGDETTARQVLQAFLTTRMKTAATITESGSELVQLIRDERAREFICEGHRWFDLRRYSVSTPYPYTKRIEHGHAFNLAYSTITFGYLPERIDYYQLEPGDAALTLPLPRAVRNFQPSIGNNNRPERPVIRTEQ